MAKYDESEPYAVYIHGKGLIRIVMRKYFKRQAMSVVDLYGQRNTKRVSKLQWAQPG